MKKAAPPVSCFFLRHNSTFAPLERTYGNSSERLPGNGTDAENVQF